MIFWSIYCDFWGLELYHVYENHTKNVLVYCEIVRLNPVGVNFKDHPGRCPRPYIIAHPTYLRSERLVTVRLESAWGAVLSERGSASGVNPVVRVWWAGSPLTPKACRAHRAHKVWMSVGANGNYIQASQNICLYYGFLYWDVPYYGRYGI